VGAWTVNILDSILGVDYYFFWFGFWRERLNLPKALFFSIALSIYPLALASFVISRARRHDTTSSGQLLDPFYRARYPLRTLVVCYPVINFLTTIHDFIVEGVVVGVISGILLAFSVAVSVFLWRLIPNRPIDIIFLRGFQGDREAIRTLRSLRRALGRRIRITGVTNPRELPRLIAFPLWVYFPIFALGDFSSANAFRHNVFLVGHWQDGIESALAASLGAVFDCGNVTDNLVWELQYAFRTLDPQALFLVYDEGSTPEEIVRLFRTRGADVAILQGIPAKRWFTRDRLVELAQSIVSFVQPKVALSN
jgi:hypothetical protein